MIEIVQPFNVNFFKHDYPNSNYKVFILMPDYVNYCGRDSDMAFPSKTSSANTKNNRYVNKCDYSMG